MLAPLCICRAWCLFACVLFAGCASGPYRYSQFHVSEAKPEPADIQIEYGKPRKTLDRIAHVVGTPARVLHLNKKHHSHELSPETTVALVKYMCKNDLADVHVCINCYEPAEQWRLLRKNDKIGPGWRYTLGSLSVLSYTIIPGRVVGGDRYNPFTNTLNLNSDVPALVLREAAYAKDVHGRRFPGAYIGANQLPVVSLWHDVKSVNDVLCYAETTRDWELEKQAYHELFPKLGETAVTPGAMVAPIWWEGAAIGLGGRLAGHATGRTIAARRAARRERQWATLPGELSVPAEELPPSDSAAEGVDLARFPGEMSLAPPTQQALFSPP